MQIEVRALDEEEFEGAESGGYVYGTMSQYAENRWQRCYVYVELGREVPYRERPNDNPKTRFRKFVSCTVGVSKTLEDSESGRVTGEAVGLEVILYY
jgi:hypothetical protein